uniref:Corticotropin-releasing factor domain-containing protein n=1 Tax=Pundamilia nyererei TaxID=303518 RepID=A0A3B4G0Y3_9CICH
MSVKVLSPPGHRGLRSLRFTSEKSDEPPISLDLTFHLLREVLEMARAEQIAQQADSNRMIMDTLGK